MFEKMLEGACNLANSHVLEKVQRLNVHKLAMIITRGLLGLLYLFLKTSPVEEEGRGRVNTDKGNLSWEPDKHPMFLKRESLSPSCFGCSARQSLLCEI